jgi:hypothetical protein
MLSLLGYPLFSHSETCSVDQFWISLLATILRSFLCLASLGSQSQLPCPLIGFTGSIRWTPTWRATSRLTVDAVRPGPPAISRIDQPDAIPREILSRSSNVSDRCERRGTA